MDEPDYESIVLQSLGELSPPANPYVPLKFINPISLAGKPIPRREWIVEDWLPTGVVTLSYGDGGVGKTLLAQQLMTSCATGRPWCGLQVRQCQAVGLFCEDDEEELHRRQHDINVHHDLNLSDLQGMRWASGAGEDNVLIRFEQDGSPRLTERFTDLCEFARVQGAKLVVVDTAADTFGGNENDRSQVRQYVGNALTKLARDLDAAVLLNAHPSRAGMTSGTVDSGSTGWSNSARSRWALTRPKASDGEAVDPNERILTRMKANYSTIGDSIKLTWRNGLLLPHGSHNIGPLAHANRKQEIEALFLMMLERALKQERNLSPLSKSGNYAPEIFANAPDRQNFKRNDFVFALEALRADNRVVVESYGPPSKRAERLTLPARPADETEGAG